MQKRDKPGDGILELIRAFTICVDMLKGLRKIKLFYFYVFEIPKAKALHPTVSATRLKWLNALAAHKKPNWFKSE